ncbi:MAG: type II secretion system F family protein, partial [Deltaproteobacteria bacterium]|nr:type II secretion system F family protein [Deltaproteobacteria bacterium]
VAGFFLGAKDMPESYNRISRRLHQAGYRGVRAVRIFWGLRIFLCLAFGFGGLVVSVSSNARMSDMLLLAGAGAFLGYFLPFLTVYRKARARVLEMRETLPDTLDLLVVCVEAGMGVDAALTRVAREQSQQGLAIGDELLLATQEMQAGAVRKEALVRLAERCGVEEFRALISFLTQTEEIGGSVARSLRVYAETMRDKRSQAAEEAARKAVIKLIFPLVFFILPAIFILIIGPPGLQIMKALSSPLK